ncbi:hypothetical protein MIR68_006133 [Amoeboaphelidium protococcarum]|nr:hypothetical protein MIR68_006133 [Amoeboaphelidium protococcarum]
MKTVILSLIALFPMLALCESVVDLTPSNFDTVVDGSKNALVEFYAPWCGHCKKLKDTWDQLGDAFAASSDVVIAKVDADAHRDLGSRFGIQGFPTIKWFPKGVTSDPEDYKGGRTLDDFAKFIQDKTGVGAKLPESSVIVLDDDNFDKVVKNESVATLVEFYAPWCGHCQQLAPIYEKLAKAFENEPGCQVAKLDATVSPKVAELYSIQGYPTLKFFPYGKDKSKVEEYEKGRDLTSLIQFLNEKCQTSRDDNGELLITAGVFDHIVPFFEKFMAAADQKSRDGVLADLKKIVKSVAAEYVGHPYFKRASEYSIKLLEKAGKDLEHPTKELERLKRILTNKDSLLPARRDDMVLRSNIIESLVQYLKARAHEEL